MTSLVINDCLFSFKFTYKLLDLFNETIYVFQLFSAVGATFIIVISVQKATAFRIL